MADRAVLYKYHGNKCAHCGKTVEQMIAKYGTYKLQFELNHIDPQKKATDYENLIRRKLSSDVMDEVDKCVLLCGECHGALHAQSLNGGATFTVKVGRNKLTQTFAGQYIYDGEKKTLTFFTDEDSRLLYWVQVGERKAKPIGGSDLREALMGLFAKTKYCKSIKIYESNGQVVLKAWKLDTNSVEVRHKVPFPPMKADLFGDGNDSGKEVLWIRRHGAVTKDGVVIKTGKVEYTFLYSEIEKNL